MNILYMAHSGTRYLVLLAAVVAVVMLAMGFVRSRRGGEAQSPGLAKGSRIGSVAFVGFLDLQVLLGIILVVVYVSEGLYYPALIGHIVMMFAAAVAAHVGSVLAKKRTGPGAYTAALFGVLAALALIVGGILAIGRGVMQSIPSPF
ncbi:MAG TPA: hypothetical protein VK013_09785 [Myxococcaceae bacterium]|nr:hypothetical protein [Myxococcaceae bacterium]